MADITTSWFEEHYVQRSIKATCGHMSASVSTYWIFPHSTWSSPHTVIHGLHALGDNVALAQDLRDLADILPGATQKLVTQTQNLRPNTNLPPFTRLTGALRRQETAIPLTVENPELACRQIKAEACVSTLTSKHLFKSKGNQRFILENLHYLPLVQLHREISGNLNCGEDIASYLWAAIFRAQPTPPDQYLRELFRILMPRRLEAVENWGLYAYRDLALGSRDSGSCFVPILLDPQHQKYVDTTQRHLKGGVYRTFPAEHDEPAYLKPLNEFVEAAMAEFRQAATHEELQRYKTQYNERIVGPFCQTRLIVRAIQEFCVRTIKEFETI